jgi:hypothetical protein
VFEWGMGSSNVYFGIKPSPMQVVKVATHGEGPKFSKKLLVHSLWMTP